MSQSVDDHHLEARVADLLGRVTAPSVPTCERCGAILVRGAPKSVNSLALIRTTGQYYHSCGRADCAYLGSP
jgi:hypothetical protein